MAVIKEWTPELGAEWEAWLATRPQIIQDLARRFPPNKLFLLKTSGHRVYPLSYNEDGTLRVMVSGEYNMLMFAREVFGISPEDLEECDLPAEGETLGAII